MLISIAWKTSPTVDIIVPTTSGIRLLEETKYIYEKIYIFHLLLQTNQYHVHKRSVILCICSHSISDKNII